MKVIFKSHLKNRLKQRQIPLDYPRKILDKPDQRYLDTPKGRHIAIRRLKYKNKMRPMMVAYDIIGQDLEIITIHPENSKQIENRIKSGRWIKYEKS